MCICSWNPPKRIHSFFRQFPRFTILTTGKSSYLICTFLLQIWSLLFCRIHNGQRTLAVFPFFATARQQVELLRHNHYVSLQPHDPPRQAISISGNSELSKLLKSCPAVFWSNPSHCATFLKCNSPSWTLTVVHILSGTSPAGWYNASCRVICSAQGDF